MIAVRDMKDKKDFPLTEALVAGIPSRRSSLSFWLSWG